MEFKFFKIRKFIKEIDDERNQYFIISGVLTSTDKFIDEEYDNVVRSYVKDD